MRPVALTAGLILIVLGAVAIIGGAGTSVSPWLGVVCVAGLGLAAAATALWPDQSD